MTAPAPAPAAATRADAPLLAYHVDLKRPMWTRAYLETTVDRLRGWGFNALVYEIEDKLRFARHPRLAHADAWSAGETADFVASCRAKGMDVVPLMQSLGHAENVVGRPEFAHLREHPDALNQYDPASPEAHALILELFDEVLDAFRPARFFHIGGDETWRLGTSERHRAMVAEIGVGGLYLRHMLPILEHVWRRGTRPMIWADMLLTYPETLDAVPEYVVLVDWEYGRTSERSRTVRLWGAGHRSWREIWEYRLAGDRRAEMAARFAADEQTAQDGTLRTYYHVHALRAMGRDVVTASAVRSGSDTQAMPKVLHVANVATSVRVGTENGLGELVTSWTVRHAHPEVTMPAVYAAPHALRHPRAMGEAAVYGAYTEHTFGVRAAELGEVQRLAAVGFPLSQTTTIRHAAHRLLQGRDVAAQLRSEAERWGGPVELFSAGTAPWDRPIGAAADVDEGTDEGAGSGDRLRRAVGQTEAALEGIAQARRMVGALRARATRGLEVLDYWEEGVDLAAFYGAFALAALRDRLAAERGSLLDRLTALRERSRALWARTFTAGSLQLEMDTRYGFHEACLVGGGASVLRRIADPVQPPFHLVDPNERRFGTTGT